MESTLLEHPRSPTFMDAPFTYNSLSNLDPYLQYPQSPYSVSTIALPGPSSSSPCFDFNTLNLTNTVSKYLYTPSANYTTTSPSHLYTPPDNGISPPAIYNLSGGELSSNGLTSGPDKPFYVVDEHWPPEAQQKPGLDCINSLVPEVVMGFLDQSILLMLRYD
ncbi:hypothetical protein EV363DRAFT_1510617 [Boletus edulis]|uniref:Uncharacterized protein n=1 Tax=Boletus edulis BED1 TaxID=1328754 RepID=A0AAD4BFJ2_BOLED|nr:hypothetical protein EV363DRAFT_1510617 [Boletus edulis]KAF8425059.1 hypothetical protein L210DRAFT_3653250 [Boletus edulis BED1]